MLRQYELVDLVKSYDPDADEDALNRAYVFAMKKHGAQLRASGDPYYSHPVEVAGILTKFKLDCASVIAGLLHDTVEDTAFEKSDIEKNFGTEVAELVDGVTKLSRINFNSKEEQQAENGHQQQCRQVYTEQISNSFQIFFQICRHSGSIFLWGEAGNGRERCPTAFLLCRNKRTTAFSIRKSSFFYSKSASPAARIGKCPPGERDSVKPGSQNEGFVPG